MPTKDFSNIFSILKAFENSGVLLAGTADTISNKIEEQINRFFGTFLGTLVVGLLPNLLWGKGIHRKSYGIYRLGFKVRHGSHQLQDRKLLNKNNWLIEDSQEII